MNNRNKKKLTFKDLSLIGKVLIILFNIFIVLCILAAFYLTPGLVILAFILGFILRGGKL